MSDNKIFIDESTLRRDVLAFLRSPAGNPILETFHFPFIVCLIIALITAVVGICMLPTVVLTLSGLKVLWSVIKLEPFQALSQNAKDHPEILSPLIAHGVIIGPDRKHALALGTFQSPSQCSPAYLGRKAAFLGSVYMESVYMVESDGGGSEHAALRRLLRDDTYKEHRRRRVPEPYAEGFELFLFDVVVDCDEGRETPYGTILFAFVAEYDHAQKSGDKGLIQAIPWRAVEGAVTIKA